MLKRALFILAFMLATTAASADDGTNDVLVDMFAWWNEAIKN